ncbi:aminoacyl-tRNA hydrolase [Alkalibacter rhizosphaerae]|uniref:Peptidyl-tRNA hydrolase n=1 Tax=Alkalibacter rhizosphaerae TaxID=2815577 RepID=A0A974XCR9_9FIRM|nr:aminoacyl-tRNA hydrolase [Alkalibacter rhizosphaerae]QSX07438.1 aminoacyl-tRNA hydrolase [Alkalibacter rhizosphaerae]
MKAIIGLGNPERRYEKTRHNIGFDVIDRLAQKHQVSFRSKHGALVGECWLNREKVLLVKPQTYMNRSGEAVRDVVEYHQLDEEDILVIYDDVDLEVGKIRIRPSGSAGTHNGMRSIIYQMNSDEMPRLRIGVGKPEFGDLAAYVLGRFSKEEEPVVEEAVRRAAEAVEVFLEEDVQEAMNRYNG